MFMTLTKFVRLGAVTIGALCVAAQVNAADLYAGNGLKDRPVYDPAPTWTGFYLGAHVGGAWGELKNNYNYKETYLDGSSPWGYADGWKNTNDGVFGGGTVGYNYQTGAFVLGFEADFGAMGFSNTHNYYSAANDVYYWNKQDASFYADVTGRLGYAAGPALFYVKGGWAYLDNSSSFGFGSSVGSPWYTDKSLDGWTVGGGIEYMWSPNWSVKAEYLYFDFSKNNHNGDDGLWLNGTQYGNWTDHFDNQLTINTFKVGLNYHFNNVYTPLK
jgi:opacity protein-like surface antigen